MSLDRARYRGKCFICEARIEPGDPVKITERNDRRGYKISCKVCAEKQEAARQDIARKSGAYIGLSLALLVLAGCGSSRDATCYDPETEELSACPMEAPPVGAIGNVAAFLFQVVL